MYEEQYFRHPCTTTEMTRIGIMAVGYGCGTIRMFDPTVKLIEEDAEDQLPMVVQMSAHARCVTSMSAAKDADLLLSVSEDSWIRVWKISSTVIYNIIKYNLQIILVTFHHFRQLPCCIAI
jgi:hypothetical protein